MRFWIFISYWLLIFWTILSFVLYILSSVSWYQLFLFVYVDFWVLSDVFFLSFCFVLRLIWCNWFFVVVTLADALWFVMWIEFVVGRVLFLLADFPHRSCSRLFICRCSQPWFLWGLTLLTLFWGEGWCCVVDGSRLPLMAVESYHFFFKCSDL